VFNPMFIVLSELGSLLETSPIRYVNVDQDLQG
jgi:hypothetical protein